MPQEEPFHVDYRRVAKNTVYLYLRMLFSMGIGLYTSRLVFQALDVSDYGILNVVGGVLGLFAFINGTLTSGTQRFMSISVGKGDIAETKRIFSATLTIHIIIAFVVCLVTEVVGVYLINNKLAIPSDRLYSALWVFHLSVSMMFVNISQVPFDAILIAREKMNVYAYMGIYNVIMGLIVALLLTYVDGYDKLIGYSVMGTVSSILGLIILRTYCIRNFKEAKFSFGWDSALYKEILEFSGWNIMGVMAWSGATSGVSVLLNTFFSTVVNAARGISDQVNGWATKFVSDFQSALNPQITKAYAVGKIDDMWSLTKRGSMYSGFLVIILGLPIWLEISPILNFWLGSVPEHTVSFSRIIIVQSLIFTMSRPLVTVVHATGRMKLPNIINGSALLMIVPVSYAFLRFGASPELVLMLNVSPWVFQIIAELYIVKYYVRINAKEFWNEVLLKNLIVLLLSVPIPALLHFYFLYFLVHFSLF